MSQKVYELVDVSDEDMYFTYGLFTSLDKAIGHVAEYDPEDSITEHGDETDYEEFEIRVRELDQFSMDTGTAIYKFERFRVLDWSNDKYFWRTEGGAL